jgi:DNA-binding SARP family transcriptional activator
MEILEAQGNRANALLVYDELRHLLREEMGIDPSAPVQDVYQRLLR